MLWYHVLISWYPVQCCGIMSWYPGIPCNAGYHSFNAVVSCLREIPVTSKAARCSPSADCSFGSVIIESSPQVWGVGGRVRSHWGDGGHSDAVFRGLGRRYRRGRGGSSSCRGKLNVAIMCWMQGRGGVVTLWYAGGGCAVCSSKVVFWFVIAWYRYNGC